MDEDELIRKVEECIDENIEISRKHAHSMFVGPPGSGKSSLMDRLTGKPPRKEFSTSTGVSESIVVVDLGKDNPSTFHPVAVSGPSTWKEVEYGTSLVRQMRVTTPPSHVQPKQPRLADAPTPPMPPFASESLSEQSSADLVPAKPAAATTSRTKLSDSHVREMIRAVVEKCGGYREFKSAISSDLSLYLRDTGGQMAFQELLSVVIRGPSIFVFVFRADLDLKCRFEVVYRVSASESLNCNTSSMTTEEALLQCLATVYAMDTSGKAGVETHKPLYSLYRWHPQR